MFFLSLKMFIRPFRLVWMDQSYKYPLQRRSRMQTLSQSTMFWWIFLSSKTNVVNISWSPWPYCTIGGEPGGVEGLGGGVLLSEGMGMVSNIQRRVLASSDIHGIKLTWRLAVMQTHTQTHTKKKKEGRDFSRSASQRETPAFRVGKRKVRPSEGAEPPPPFDLRRSDSSRK